MVDVDAVKDFAEHIHLFLICCTVPDTHRSRVLIATEMSQFTLAQVTFPANTVHNLQVFAVGIGQATQPVGEGTRFFCETEHVERIESKGSIT